MILALLLSTVTFIVKQVDGNSREVKIEPVFSAQFRVTQQSGEQLKKGDVIKCKVINGEDEKTHEKFTILDCNGTTYILKHTVLQLDK